MKYEIIAVPSFQRAIKKLAKHYRSLPKDYEKLVEDLKVNPQLGTDLGGGLRKVRMSFPISIKVKVAEPASSLLP